MSAAVAANSRIKDSSSEWAYNLRSWAFHDEDSSDSDDDKPPAQSQPAVSEDAKLLASLDIAGRQDEAVYKPNPWSIAKANAASRPQPDAGKANRPDKNTEKPKKKPQGRIVDFLKKQGEAPPAPDGKGLRPGLPPRTGNQPSPRPKENLLAPSRRDVSVNHSLLRTCEQLPPPIPGGPAAASSTVNFPSAPSLVSDHGFSCVRSNISPADRPLALPGPPTAHVRPPKPHTSTLDSSSRSDRFLAPPGNAFASIPDPAPAFYSSPPPSHRPNFTDFAAYANSRRVPARSSAQSHNAASPERLSDTHVPANAGSGRVDASTLVSPVRNSSPVSPYDVPHGFPLVPPHSQPPSHSPATRHEYATPVPQQKRQRVPLPVFKSFSSPPGQLSGFVQAVRSRPNSAYIHPHRSLHVPPPGSSPQRRHVRDGRFGSYRRSVERDQGFNRTTAVTALAPLSPDADAYENESPSGLDFDDDYGHVHPAVYSNRLSQARGSTPARASQDLLVHVPRSSPHVATPRAETVRTIDHSQRRPPKRRRPSPTPSPSPSPPPSTSASRLNASVSRSAYAHPSLAPEQDEAWSTLQPRSAAGKTAKKDKSGIKSSGKFRVPLLLRGPVRGVPGKSDIGGAEGQTAAKKPRVVLYRPPPRAAPSDPSMEHDNSLYTVRGGDVPTTSPRGGDDSTPDPESSAGFDVKRVESRYAGVRRKMKKRRHASSGVWDLLQLPSCGVVYVDLHYVDLHGDENRRSVLDDTEIEIVRWDGQKKLLVWDSAS